MSRSNDLVPLLFPPPSDQLGFRQGTVVSFDLDNGTNTIDVGGAQLTNVPLLNVTDSVSLEPGTVVALLTWKSSWWIIGRVIIPGSAGYGELCAFENNGEGVCLTQNGLDIYPPNPPEPSSTSGVARIFAQHFFNTDGRMWLEMIPPREKGTTGDNRFILEGGIEGGTDGSFTLFTLGEGTIETGLDCIMRAGGNAFIDADQQIQLLSGELAVFIDHQTTGNAANCFIGTNGIIQRSTSSRRYKQDIEDISINPKEVINLRPRTWRDKIEVNKNSDSDRWYVGFIAEEVDELGLGVFVDYDEEGQPDSIAYDRLSVALIELIKHQDKRLTDLENRVADLDNKSTSVPASSTTPKPKRFSSSVRPVRKDS